MLIFGFFIGLIVGVPVVLYLINFAADHVTYVLTAFVVVTIIVAILLLVIFFFRKRILEGLKLKADKVLTDCIEPATSSLRHALAGDIDASITQLRNTLTILLSWWYSGQRNIGLWLRS
jgi:hypothetical protein